MEKNTEYNWLITTEKLLVDISLEEYLKNIKKVNNNIKILYLAEKLSIEEKNILYKYNVFNILESSKIDFNMINEIIFSNKNIIYKTNNNIKNNKIIAFFGTSGSGKSTLSYLFSKQVARIKNTLLIDLDIQNSCIDILVNEKKYSKNILDVIDNLNVCNDDEYVKEILYKEENLSCIFSNLSLYETQSKIKMKDYQNLKKYLNKYECTVIDLTNCIFIDQIKYFLLNSTDIVFVINPNYISIRQGLKYLEVINQLWKIPKEKIKIIINKSTSKSLDKNFVKKLLSEYLILDEIKYNNKIEEYINLGNINPNIFSFKKILENLKLVDNSNKLNKWVNIYDK